MTIHALPTAVTDAIARGWSIIPVDINKKPYFSWKPYQQERATPEQLAQWQKQYNPAGWAVITGKISNLIILDGDGTPGKETFGSLGINPHRKTGSGGLHCDFEHPGWYVPTLNSKSKKELGERWQGLDIRGDGGYAVFCGRNTSGEYTWLRTPGELDSLDTLPNDLRSFLGLLTAPEEKMKRSIADVALEKALAEAHNGRDDACFRLAKQLHDNNYPQMEAESVCMEFARRVPTTNTKGKHEPFTEEDARAKVASAYSYTKRDPWSNTTNYSPGQDQSQNGNGANGSSSSTEKATSTFDEIKNTIACADNEALYDLAATIAFLPTKEQAKLIDAIKSKKLAAFSMKHFNQLMSEAVKAKKAEEYAAREAFPEYERTDTGMVYNSPMHGPVVLSNFIAEISSDVITDDGVERTRLYELQAELYGRSFRFEVAAKDFDKCGWVDQELGARARVSAGNSIKAHLGNSIKSSSDPEEKLLYLHTGWRNIDSRSVFLHSGECLSQVSQVEVSEKKDLTKIPCFDNSALQALLEGERERNSQVSQVSQVEIEGSVRLTGSLSNYALPCERENIQQAIKASLGFMDLASDTITAPLYTALWRSVLGKVDFGIHLAGQTGMGKSELAALIQQHFGASMHAKNLPGSWESTENSLEMLLFQAKDAVVVVDDFKPKGGKADQDRLHMKADRVFRQLGNGSARGRLDGNLQQRAARAPRCLLLSTGEDVPRGQSLKARGLVLIMSEYITKGEASKRLQVAQKDARSGLYAQAMAGYVEWLAPRIEAIQTQLTDLIAEERAQIGTDGHARSCSNTANLLLGMKCFLSYACESGALTEQEAQYYFTRCKNALIQIAEEASQEDKQDKQSEQWRRLIIASLTGGHAHLVTSTGDNPGPGYGWKKSVRSFADGEPDETYQGSGAKIGWLVGNDIYLEPKMAYKVAKAMGSEDLVITESMLRKFLAQDGLLASTNLNAKGRPTVTIRKSLEGEQRDVLHIEKHILFPTDPSPDNLTNLTNLTNVPSEASSEADSAPSQVVDYEGGLVKSTTCLDLTKSQNGDTPPKNLSVDFDLGPIPDEYRDLLVRYQQKVFSLNVNTPIWQAPDSGRKPTPFGKEAHIAFTKSLLRSGELSKIKAALEAMRRTLGEYQEDRRGV